MSNEIKFYCSSCGQRLSVEPAWMGREIACPSCNTLVVIPGRVESPSPEPPPQRSFPAPPERLTPPPVRTPPIPAVPRRPYSARPESGLGKAALGFGLLALPTFYLGRAIHFPLGLFAGGAAFLCGAAALVQVIVGSRKGLSAAISGMIIGPLGVIIPTIIVMYHQSAAYRQRQLAPLFNQSPPSVQRSPTSPGAGASPARPRVVDPKVTTDPTAVDIPATLLTGTLKGQVFRLDRAELQGNTLRLGQGVGLSTEASILIFFNPGFVPGAGSSVIITPGDISSQVSSIHWRTKQDSGVVSQNFAMRLEFGAVSGRQIACKLYLEFPQSLDTRLSGSFRATTK